MTLPGSCAEAGGAGRAKCFKKAGCPALGSMLGRQGMGCQCPGETLSPRLAGKDAQSWQPNPACLHAASVLLSALDITPSLCFPGRRRPCTPGLAARSPSAGPSLGKRVLGPGLRRRGQPSWQGAPGASAPRSSPACLPRRRGRAQPPRLQPRTDGPVPCRLCQAASLAAGTASAGVGGAVPALGRCPWRCLGQRLEGTLLARSPRWHRRWLRRGCGAFGHPLGQRPCCRRCWLLAAGSGAGAARLPRAVAPRARASAQGWGAQCHPLAQAAAQGWGAWCHPPGMGSGAGLGCMVSPPGTGSGAGLGCMVSPPGMGSGAGLGSTVSPPGTGSGAGLGCTVPSPRGVCVCTGVCECVCVHGWACATRVHLRPSMSACVGVCAWGRVPVGTPGVCACGYPVGVQPGDACECACERCRVCPASGRV